MRAPEVEDRQFPSHLEDNRIKVEGNASAVGNLVERTSRLLILIKLLPHPKPASAANVLQALQTQARCQLQTDVPEPDVRPKPGDVHS